MPAAITLASAIRQALIDFPEYTDEQIVATAEAAIAADHRAREAAVSATVDAAALRFTAYARAHPEGS